MEMLAVVVVCVILTRHYWLQYSQELFCMFPRDNSQHRSVEPFSMVVLATSTPCSYRNSQLGPVSTPKRIVDDRNPALPEGPQTIGELWYIPWGIAGFIPSTVEPVNGFRLSASTTHCQASVRTSTRMSKARYLCASARYTFLLVAVRALGLRRVTALCFTTFMASPSGL